MDTSSPFAALSEWSFELAGRWQIVAGLRTHPKRRHLIAALEMILDTSPPLKHPLARLLMRGFLLELVDGLRIGSLKFRATVQVQLHQVCDRICERGQVDHSVQQGVRELLATLHGPPLHEDQRLAFRAREWIDSLGGARVTVPCVARAVGANKGRVDSAFRRIYGVSIAAHIRQRVAAAALAASVRAIPLSRTAYDLHCTEATLRRLIRSATGRTPKEVRRR